MIGLLRGKLLEKNPGEALVLCNGVGYEVQIPLNAYERLPETGAEVALHTHFSVREDAQVLFGFIDAGGKRLFRELIRVSGVGPRMALALLSGTRPGDLAAAVQAGDVARLSKAPGIGRKTAERIVVELRDRLAESAGYGDFAAHTGAPGQTAPGGAREAVAALVSLGYKQQQAARLVAAVEREHPELEETSELIRIALQSLAPGGGGR